MPKTFGTENKSGLTWIVFIGILVIYLSFPTRNYFFDGIDFSHTIEAASRINTSLIIPIISSITWLATSSTVYSDSSDWIESDCGLADNG